MVNFQREINQSASLVYGAKLIDYNVSLTLTLIMYVISMDYPYLPLPLPFIALYGNTKFTLLPYYQNK